eukprot:TRINITY_DN7590_c0_g1_i2.p1 TRINITY_DN7590_c0_g1~~TRINITY_DN7590_c0_g1_i2.p1  ORF type:complete len:152 (-),score=35.13 TRINITY_DN7590_c0_g1_i2:200-655(-)
MLDRMMAEIEALKLSHEHTENQRTDQKNKSEAAILELQNLRRENATLRAKVEEEHRQFTQMSSDKAKLECEREEDLERLYNLGAMHPESSTQLFSYVRTRSESVSSQDSGKSGPTRWRSASSPSPPPSTLSGNSTRSSTRSSTPFEKQRKH